MSEGKYIDVDLAAGKRFAANFLDAIPNRILRMSRSDVGCMMWVVGTATISSLHKWATLAISDARNHRATICFYVYGQFRGAFEEAVFALSADADGSRPSPLGSRITREPMVTTSDRMAVAGRVMFFEFRKRD